MTLWTLDELSEIGELHNPGGTQVSITGVSIDSRQVKPGDLFIALSGDPGPRFHGGVDNPRDGHEFIPAAIEAGAAAILLSEGRHSLSVPSIQVDDTLDGLWHLSRLARRRCSGQIIAITGSAGKTTAKSWLSECLAEQFKVHSAEGSLNNHWGVPLSLARMPADTEVGVIEIGTNHSGEIGPLSELTKPTISVLLNVLPAHIGNFASIDALREEKLAIAAGLQPGGILILPRALAAMVEAEATLLNFGFEDDADVSASYEVTTAGWQVQANVCGETTSYRFAAGGEHRIQTSLVVLAVAKQLGANLDQVTRCLAKLEAPAGRGNQIELNSIRIIDDSYNANPVSMQFALAALASTPGRSIAILGEILELGAETEQYHQQVANTFSDIDLVLTVGAGFASCPGNRHYSTAAEIDLAEFVAELKPQDHILIKGSNKVFWKSEFVQKLTEAIRQAA